ncbi:MAG: hypothetical protein QOI75_5612, partial [Pseudonocardiales bacterium]|nr:hypothetical protein [Pseudonocardiales bacterium]
VRVRADRQPGAVRLVVEDSGPGLPAADRARATQRFWRAAKDGNGPGTGLGLAIAERLVTARAGSLRLLPGEPTGLAVQVTLPHADATEPPETAEPAASDPAASDPAASER